MLSTMSPVKPSGRSPTAERTVLAPPSRIPWTQDLVLLVISILPCAAHADIAPGPMRASPSVELTVDGLGPNHVLFTRESLSAVFTDGRRPLRVFWAARLPYLHLMEKRPSKRGSRRIRLRPGGAPRSTSSSRAQPPSPAPCDPPTTRRHALRATTRSMQRAIRFAFTTRSQKRVRPVASCARSA
ncbi:MAG: hypothetical protein RLZZ450_4494 [Pseudomonadota bacterium]